jgi:hypothetical protein
MELSYTYTKDASCCPGEDVTITVKRVIIADLSKPRPSGFICGHRADIESVINYKALSKRNGNTRQYSVKRVGLVGARSRLGQSVQAVGSMLTPGNISRVRSPVRSRLYSALTPGMGGLPGRGIRGRERSYRCPEGYQFGGRFTDSQLSTCGQQLFDFPSILGETIAAIRRSQRGVGSQATQSTGLGRGRDIADQRERRDPNRTIPRVGPANRQLQRQKVQQLIPQMGKPDIQAHRMIRRDGFDLEPVVTPAVLRTIPDSRDMEGATYLMNIAPEGIGGEELGLLSNTGVTNLTYVRDDGTSVSIAKVRELTVGERRKLGRTVNAAMKREAGDDELSRLQYVSEETGDGIQVTEGGAARAPRPSAAGVTERAPRETPDAPEAPEAPESDKITSVDEALAHIAQGGNLSDIAPSILEEVLREKNALEVTKKLVTTPQKRQYIIRNSKNNFEHLHASFASEVQHHLGLTSPDVAFVGKGDKRRYLLQDAASTLDGATVDRRKTVNNASPREMTAMLIADILTGINKRLPTSLSTVSSKDKTRLVAANNPSDLVPLDKLEIRKAAQQRIEEMRSLLPEGIYGKYFDSLQAEQQKLVQTQMTRLIQRAETFDASAFRQSLSRNGELSPAEKAHLAIIETIFDTRLGILRNSLKRIITMVGGGQ